MMSIRKLEKALKNIVKDKIFLLVPALLFIANKKCLSVCFSYMSYKFPRIFDISNQSNKKWVGRQL